MIFGDEVFGIGDVGLFEDAVTVNPDEEIREIAEEEAWEKKEPQ